MTTPYFRFFFLKIEDHVVGEWAELVPLLQVEVEVVLVWEVATGCSSPESHRCSTVCVLTVCNLFALICFAVPGELRF